MDKTTWAEYIFLLVLITFTTLIALLKNLLLHMRFDKSHMASHSENATEGIILADQSASIILANPSACHMFGYEAEELVGKKVEVLLPVRFREGHVHLRDGFMQKPQNREMVALAIRLGKTKKAKLTCLG